MPGHFPPPWAVGECGRSYKEAEGVAQVAVLLPEFCRCVPACLMRPRVFTSQTSVSRYELGFARRLIVMCFEPSNVLRSVPPFGFCPVKLFHSVHTSL